MIEKQGVLRAYSGRSMERTIGRYKKLIKSKVNVGANAGNVLERFTIYGHVNSLNIDMRKTLNLLEPKRYTTNSFISLDPQDETAPQLWSPISQYPLSALPCGISSLQLTNALKKFCQRVYSISYQPTETNNNFVNVAGRAWFNDIVYTTTLYKEHIKERRRGNNYVMFAASHLNNLNRLINQLYVGSIAFFFETSFNGVDDFLVLIDVAESHGVVNYDKYMPKVGLRRPGHHKYVVCRFDDIVCNVGLVRYTNTENHYSDIPPYIQRTFRF